MSLTTAGRSLLYPHAVHDSFIETYGCSSLALAFGLRKHFALVFVVPAVHRPDLCHIYLYRFNLDNQAKRWSPFFCFSHPYLAILHKYASLIHPVPRDAAAKPTVVQHIHTGGLSQFSRFLRLADRQSRIPAHAQSRHCSTILE